MLRPKASSSIARKKSKRKKSPKVHLFRFLSMPNNKTGVRKYNSKMEANTVEK